MKIQHSWKTMLAMFLCSASLNATGAGVLAAEAPNTKLTIEPQAHAIIENLASRYKGARSYSDVMSLHSTGAKPFSADMADEFNFRAQVAWQRPNKARIVKYSGQGMAHSTSDGKILNAVTPRYKGYYLKRPANFNSINDAMNEIGVGAPGLGHIIEGQGVAWMVKGGLVSLKMGTDTVVDGVAVQRIIARMEFPSGGSAVETLAIRKRDGLLRQVTQEYESSKGRSTFVETHTQIKLNPALPDSTFAFTPPDDAKEIDYYSKLNPNQFKPSIKVGGVLPAFQATDLNEKPISLDDYKGQVVIIHFFASWEATAADVPRIVQLFNRYKDEGLAVIGVALDARRERVTELVAKEQVPYPVIFDEMAWNHPIAKLYGVRSLPTTLIVNRDGTLRVVASRPSEVGFEEAIAAALANKKEQIPDTPNLLQFRSCFAPGVTVSTG